MLIQARRRASSMLALPMVAGIACSRHVTPRHKAAPTYQLRNNHGWLSKEIGPQILIRHRSLVTKGL